MQNKEIKKVVEYTKDFQQLFLEIMLEDAEKYVRVQNIFNIENFHKSLQPTAEMIKEHSNKYNTLPDKKQIQVQTGVKLMGVPSDISYDWFLDSFEDFTKQKELSRAIMESYDLLEKGEYGPVEQLIKDAVQIGLMKDHGTSYFENIKERIQDFRDNSRKIKTGWKTIDNKLYGGLEIGGLHIFAGGSGSGKSLVMQNLLINWAQRGLNGVLITLELSELFACNRMDAMVSSTPTQLISKDLDNVVMKIGLFGKKSGSLRVKYLSPQSNANDIRTYLRELEIETGTKVDVMCVDYLDLLTPATVKVGADNTFNKDKYVAEDLRSLASELEIVVVSASQLNRSAVEEIEFDHSHIAGGISKINTADNVFAIFTNTAMKERGKDQLQLMKTRSSSGIGSKIDLDYDNNTMRITDPGLEEEVSPTTNEIMNNLKNKTLTNTTTESGKIKVDMNSKLQGLLNNIQRQ